jgi:hypothetical protein
MGANSVLENENYQLTVVIQVVIQVAIQVAIQVMVVQALVWVVH